VRFLVYIYAVFTTAALGTWRRGKKEVTTVRRMDGLLTGRIFACVTMQAQRYMDIRHALTIQPCPIMVTALVLSQLDHERYVMSNS
jgi:hypothetical protein